MDKLSLIEIVRLLPKSPGVYRFLDESGSVIYIGKAKELRSRVSQYFQAEESLSGKSRVMVKRIAAIEHTVVESEEDALLLENNLIKEYQPRYNILLKDDKSFPWICVKKEPFPRVFTTRQKRDKGSLYFGPYSSALQARNLVRLIHSLYNLRDCSLPLNSKEIKSGKFKSCLKYHLDRCDAPCIDKISEEQYNQQIERAISLLKGDSGKLIKEFKGRMEAAAKGMRFEEAQKFKERMELLQNHMGRSIIVSQSLSNLDIFSLAIDSEGHFGNHMQVIKGSIVRSLNMEFKVPLDEEPSAVMSRFITAIHQEYGDSGNALILSILPDSEALAKRALIPQRGEKHYLLKLSLKNATQFKRERLKQLEIIDPKERERSILEKVQKELGLNELPLHIECFDNSNIQGDNPVSACVLFRNGKPSKREYRHFIPKSVKGANDYATIEEVVYRRYSRVLDEGGALPNLIVIDGGIPQIGAAYSALQKLDLEREVTLLAIAERLESIYRVGDPNPLLLDKGGVTLRLLMQIRDEAHRFALSHHRKRHIKSQLISELRSIPGVGERREQQLLTKFGSLKMIKAATTQELAEVVGNKMANTIKHYLQKASSK